MFVIVFSHLIEIVFGVVVPVAVDDDDQQKNEETKAKKEKRIPSTWPCKNRFCRMMQKIFSVWQKWEEEEEEEEIVDVNRKWVKNLEQ